MDDKKDDVEKPRDPKRNYWKKEEEDLISKKIILSTQD